MWIATLLGVTIITTNVIKQIIHRADEGVSIRWQRTEDGVKWMKVGE